MPEIASDGKLFPRHTRDESFLSALSRRYKRQLSQMSDWVIFYSSLSVFPSAWRSSNQLRLSY
jgi:hypothetical protein